ncbi:MAG: hypothetical protein A3F11_02125 [Gammaproteobacteria bacterium RIFCSPHIGHO2_12_FULL_37_14]|nr:MAG: hypothetical protein A3F11_02125 [Gammaproteobacteria bacterium RIFCSPHIGHO2_12_FULL_37_14]
MPDNSIFIKNGQLLLRQENFFSIEIDDELVMMDATQGCYFSLNDVAKTIWTLLESPKSYADLLQELITTYAIDKVQCQRDIEPFLLDLLKNKLITTMS